MAKAFQTGDIQLAEVLESEGALEAVRTTAAGPAGPLHLTEEMLRNWASGDLFGISQNVGMGWAPSRVQQKEFLILSTSGGVRADDGTPVALGFHTGHWEVGLLVREAARELARLGATPFAGACTDPCDGRTQGTPGMMDSLAFRNDAAMVMRRLIRSLPRRAGVMGVATCDKGLPAMMMALAAGGALPAVLVPGGVTLPPEHGEDAGKVQTIGVRFSRGEMTLAEAEEAACHACASPGGGCQFLGTAATSQVVGEALGLSLPHSALSPSGQPIWLDMAMRSARALVRLEQMKIGVRDILTPAAIRNAMVVHAAFGGSTNLLLHIPAIAHAAGLARPGVDEWIEVNRATPRLVDALPNGPVGHPTVRVFLAGGVPEVMLHLRRMGLIDGSCLTAAGVSWDEALDWWEASARRARLKENLRERDGVEAQDVIFNPDRAKARGLASTITFPRGNLAPRGAVIKSTAIDVELVDGDGVYRHTGPARVFVTEPAAIEAIKQGNIRPGDVVVLICRGPMGAGMEEIYQVTSALRYLKEGRRVALITDARFSGVSTGACIGHASPEALAGGPIGKVVDGDLVQIVIDRGRLVGTVDLIGEAGTPAADCSIERGSRILASRAPRADLAPDPRLPADTRLWAALQEASGGTWGGCVYDVDAISEALSRGRGI